MNYPKRLIEVDLPIKRISAHSRREKSIRHGHISTLHIWWARRPLAACRAVLCASLWPDPTDPLCPDDFTIEAKEQMLKWSDNEHLKLLSRESIEHFIKVNHDKTLLNNKTFLRQLLLDFIADFSNWDNSTQQDYLLTSRSLTQIAHNSLGDSDSNRPIIADPFAGGGSIPLEILRVGGDCFASDINPIPYLINKVLIEYIPKYGDRLVKDLPVYGDKLIKYLYNDLFSLYQGISKDENILAFIWARTINCEGPNCGVRVPLIRNLWISQKRADSFALQLNYDEKGILFPVVLKNPTTINVKEGTVRRGSVICPCCGYTTPVSSTRIQLNKKEGGVKDSTLLYIVVENQKTGGKSYRTVSENDINIYNSAVKKLNELLEISPESLPTEALPLMSGVFNVPIYGHHNWGSLFNSRQALSLIKSVEYLNSNIFDIDFQNDKEYKIALKTCLAFVIDRCADYWSSLAVWAGDFIAHTFGRQALGIIWDFAEANPFAVSSGNLLGAINWVTRVIEECNISANGVGSILQSSATSHPLPDHSVDYVFTDPPYYNAVPYADLSDFFYVWLKRSIGKEFPAFFRESLAPKREEICEMAGWDSVRYSIKDRTWYENQMGLAMKEAKRISKPSSVCIVVFAHKTTEGWEAQIKAMIDAGWVFTGSWPIDTERPGRLRANNSAALASSVHLICRPRSLELDNDIGDWRDILFALPKRIHEWMPRLASEGIVGADAIFSCLGPALEIYSKYSSVEKPNGEKVELKEYLEQVWASVSQEAISMVFSDADARALEEDARITAMWLWTLSTNTNSDSNQLEDGEIEEDEEEIPKKSPGGFYLEYDTARKIAQGLGARLENMRSVVEIKGDKARLLPVEERTKHLFGIEGYKQKVVKKKRDVQLSIFAGTGDDELSYTPIELKVENTGKTTLDRLHQAMLLFAASRSEALKRFLIEDGVGKDDNFWKLAQALNALYPQGTNERRWVEGVQTFKKGLGY